MESQHDRFEPTRFEDLTMPVDFHCHSACRFSPSSSRGTSAPGSPRPRSRSSIATNGATTPYAEAFVRAGDVERSIERFASRSVTRAIERAIVSRRPRTRYAAPWIHSFGPWMAVLVPTRWLDAIMQRVAGLRLPEQLSSGERPALTAE